MQIKRPCPANLSKMQASDGGYFCSSCEQTVVDFRDKSIEEIKDVLRNGGCGIFLPQQLQKQQNYQGFNRFLFIGLTFVSLLGFSVRPLQAQTNPDKNTKEGWTVYPPKSSSEVSRSDMRKTRRENKKTQRTSRRAYRRLFRRGPFRRHVMGCPDF
ncbi:MAG: hypothetical protein JJ975_02005 [Bacteroidia bacterium]|nr:hypothetical protein [Bacteroidia bacterium]